MRQVLVVCIGNRLVGDDAVGPVIYDRLSTQALPEGAVLKLLGVGGIALLDDLNGQDKLIVVDAVRFGAAPGTVHVFSGERLGGSDGMPVTSHDVSLKETLSVGRALYPRKMPKEVIFVGVEGAHFNELGIPLSPDVENAVPRAVETVLMNI